MSIFHQVSENLPLQGAVIKLLISPAYNNQDIANLATTHSVSLQALIDTGAKTTLIASESIEQMGLVPSGMSIISTATHQNIECLVYDLDLIFPNGHKISPIQIISVPLKDENIHCLIGRDILSLALFEYNGKENSFTLSF